MVQMTIPRRVLEKNIKRLIRHDENTQQLALHNTISELYPIWQFCNNRDPSALLKKYFWDVENLWDIH
jgi:hypothetical protein